MTDVIDDEVEQAAPAPARKKATTIYPKVTPSQLTREMMSRRYSFRASVIETGFLFDPITWTADRFATFTGIDIFSLCAQAVYVDQEIGDTVTVLSSIYRLEFTRIK